MRVEFVNEDERVVGAGEMPHAPRVGEKVRLLRPEQDGGSGQGELFEVVDVYYWVPNQQQGMGEERLFSFACELVDVYVRPIMTGGLPRTERFAVGADEAGR